jgi:hypothetical protein
MAKKANTTISQNATPETPVITETTITTDSETPMIETPDAPIVVASALATLQAEAMAPKVWTDDLPKPIKMLFQASPAPDDGELTAMVENLPSAQRENFEVLIESLNPVREGFVSARADFRIPKAALYHGVGDDPARPAAAPVGSVYTADGLVLAAWDKNQARSLKIGQTFEAAIILIEETRTLKMPRDKSRPLPPDIDPDSKAPICYSLDRHRGSRYGACAACPNRPYANGKWAPDACTNDARIYFVLRGFKGIYAITVKGASMKKAVQVIQRQKGRPWDVWYDLGVAEEKNELGRWFSLTATPHATDDAPQGEQTTPEERGVFRTLSRTVLHESYLPDLQRIYLAAEQPKEASGSGAADMTALLAAASAAPDYSKNNL